MRKSHPSWVCGLKLISNVLKIQSRRHTLRGCVDWNYSFITKTFDFYVTPFVGVWIETNRICSETQKREGHTLRGCVDWNNDETTRINFHHSHTLRGCVDWNHKTFLSHINTLSHTLRGCVDWNRFIHTTKRTYQMSHPSWVCGLKQRTEMRLENYSSHTLRGCVDWNSLRAAAALSRTCHTLRGCVDWNNHFGSILSSKLSHTLRGCVDWNV